MLFLHKKMEKKRVQISRLSKDKKKMLNKIIESQKEVKKENSYLEQLIEENTHLKDEIKQWRKEAINIKGKPGRKYQIKLKTPNNYNEEEEKRSQK